MIDVTEFCNLACIHCPHEEFAKSEAFGGRHLDLKLHKKLIDEVAQDGKGRCKFLRYTGQGEPLIHPHFREMVEYAGKHSEVPINVTTNGMLLNEKIAKALLNAGVNVFDFSIDAHTPETYAKIRRKGDLSVTRPNVLRLIELVQQDGFDAKVVVSFVEQPLNTQEAEDFEKFWQAAGADYVVIRRLHSCAGSKEKVAKYLWQQKIPRRSCLYPWERLVLSPSGKVGYCPADWRYTAKIASLKNMTLKEIWQSDFMKELREAHLSGNLSGYPLCAQCPDWMSVRWPHEGRSYANMMQEIVPADLVDNGA